MIYNSTFWDNILEDIVKKYYSENNVVIGNILTNGELSIEDRGGTVPGEYTESGTEEKRAVIMLGVASNHFDQAEKIKELIEDSIKKELDKYSYNQLGFHPVEFEIYTISKLDWRVTKKKLFEDQIGGKIKNMIFAATGPKPRFGYDVIRNEMNLLNEDINHYFYPSPNSALGVYWSDLLNYYYPINNKENEVAFLERLRSSLPQSSPGENKLFSFYYDTFKPYLENYYANSSFDVSNRFPVLFPQAYINIDPYTKSEVQRLGIEKFYSEERKDFILLLLNHRLIIIEVDGAQHYSWFDEEKKQYIADPKEYTKTISENRELQLRGYEIYRFSHEELKHDNVEDLLSHFFMRLFERHGVQFS